MRRRIAYLVDSPRTSAGVGGVVGLAAGAAVAAAAVATCSPRGEGFLASIVTTWPSPGAAMTVGVLCGVILGVAIGLLEGALACGVAQLFVRRRLSLTTFGRTLGIALVAANAAATLMAVRVGMQVGRPDREPLSTAWGPVLAAVMATAAAVTVLTWVHGVDWPRPDPPSATRGRRVVDVRESASTPRPMVLDGQAAYDFEAERQGPVSTTVVGEAPTSEVWLDDEPYRR